VTHQITERLLGSFHVCLKQEAGCPPWDTELRLVGKIFFLHLIIYAINEFKDNEIGRLTEQCLLCAFAYLVGLEI
jgi:hypothetical protein